MVLILNKYVGPPYCEAKMCAGSLACCPLVSHGEYDDGTDRQTDGRTPDRYIAPPLNAARVIVVKLARVKERTSI